MRNLYSLNEVIILTVPKHIGPKRLQFHIDCGDLIYNITPHPVTGYIGTCEEIGGTIHFDIRE